MNMMNGCMEMMYGCMKESYASRNHLLHFPVFLIK